MGVTGLVSFPSETEPPVTTNGEMTGLTPLMLASKVGAEDCVQRLITANANLGAVAGGGWTPLFFASAKGHMGACRLLLAARADTTLIDREGSSVLDVCNAQDAKVLEHLIDSTRKI